MRDPRVQQEAMSPVTSSCAPVHDHNTSAFTRLGRGFTSEDSTVAVFKGVRSKTTKRNLFGLVTARSHDGSPIGGTVLHAVPQARRPMSPREEVMASCPNEEILSAGGPSPSSTRSTTDWPLSPSSSYRSSASEGRGSTSRLRGKDVYAPEPDIIGVWKNNAIIWNQEHIAKNRSPGPPRLPPKDLRFCDPTARSRAVPAIQGQRTKKPGMRLYIPDSLPQLDTEPLIPLHYFDIPHPPPLSRSGTICQVSPASTTIYAPKSRSRQHIRDIISPLQLMTRPPHPLEIEAAILAKDSDSPEPTSGLIPDSERMMSFLSSSESGGGESDSSRNSDGSSRTSVDVHIESGHLVSGWNIVNRPYSIMDPVKDGVFDDSCFPRQRLMTTPRKESTSLCRTFTQSSSQSSSAGRQSASDTPTLNEARGKLEVQPSALTEGFSQSAEGLVPSTTLSPPRRSRKRDWVNGSTSQNVSRPGLSNSKSIVERSISLNVKPLADRSTLEMPVAKRITVNEPTCAIEPRRRRTEPADRRSARPLSLAITRESEDIITAEAAEAVILHILESLDAFDDLFASARINKGFYSVFKRHELKLMKCALRNTSQAAWELREISPKEIIVALEGPRSEYTPTRYLQFHTRDTYILAALKSVILVRCQSYLREGTIVALRGRHNTRASQIDEAFWRVWTFCTMFGSGKGQEDDVLGQMDWLRGGVLARELARASSPSSVKKLGSNGILLHPPESFARGNYGGLSAEELYDMTEIWNCLRALLHGIQGHGRVIQARQAGVFDGHCVETGDSEAEELLLEEWISHLMTLGPSTILDLATPSTNRSDSVFLIANDMGWTTWDRPALGGSRSTFLKEAVTRVYEEKLAVLRSAELAKDLQVHRAEANHHRRQRSEELAAQLRLKKSILDFKNVPVSEDRPMSMWMEWNTVMEGRNRDAVVKATRDTSSRKTTKTSHSPSKSVPPRLRPRTSSGALSLFPPEYSRGNTPTSTPKPTPMTCPSATPMLSRRPSATFNPLPSVVPPSTSSARSSAHSPPTAKPIDTTPSASSRSSRPSSPRSPVSPPMAGTPPRQVHPFSTFHPSMSSATQPPRADRPPHSEATHPGRSQSGPGKLRSRSSRAQSGEGGGPSPSRSPPRIGVVSIERAGVGDGGVGGVTGRGRKASKVAEGGGYASLTGRTVAWLIGREGRGSATVVK